MVPGVPARRLLCSFPAVDVRTTYTETLACAAATIGGPDRLAQFLKVSKARLTRWLAGEEAPPNEVFMEALDVIASGPWAPERRNVRVAVIDEDPPAR
jgi:hypothetical protein